MHHPLDAAMEELDEEKKRKQHPSMQWKGRHRLENDGKTKGDANNASLYAKRQKRVQQLQQGRGSGGAVPSLFDLCVRFVVDNFERVESLGSVDTAVHTAIAHGLVGAGKLHGESVRTLLAERNMEALELVDCSGVAAEELAQGLQNLKQLKYLKLDQCGRCFVGKAVETVGNGMPQLFALSIGGAYLLQDADAAQLVEKRRPSSVEFRACPLLGGKFCAAVRDSYGGSGPSKLLELCLEDVPLTEEQLELLLADQKALQNLKSLSLRRIGGLNDAIVTRLLAICGPTLEGLDLSENHQLSDAVLAAIRQHCTGRLHALTLTALKQLTGAGLEALFTFVEGASPPPRLRTLHLGQLDHEAVTDEVLHLATQAATQTSSTQQQQQMLHGGLVHLNVQGASTLTDTGMEHLAATCQRTLEALNVSFCPLVTDRGLGFLVDKCGRQLAKLEVWGNAQLTDELFDGHRRAHDATLEIAGVWMKQTASRTIR